MGHRSLSSRLNELFYSGCAVTIIADLYNGRSVILSHPELRER